MCPGLVCNATLGICVECNATGDCAAGLVCTSGVCEAPPPACASDRDCSAMGLVCDRTEMVCVECVMDVDCPSMQTCNADHVCRARAPMDAGLDASGDGSTDAAGEA